jgi:ribosome recycling factor
MGLSNSLVVDMNGQKHSLNELAQINRKSPQLVVINMASTPEAIKPVLTALAESGMNLSPQQEGTVLYVPIPKVTREHREGLATNARTMCQKAKDELKAIHSSFAAYVKRQKRAQVSEELIFNVNQNRLWKWDPKYWVPQVGPTPTWDWDGMGRTLWEWDELLWE